MADLGELDPRGRALLDAYREHRGPSPEVAARLRAAVLRDAEDMPDRPDATVVPLRRPTRARWLGPAALAALAAAVVAAFALSTAEPQRADSAGAAAPWQSSPPPAQDTATVRKPAPPAPPEQAPPPEPTAPATPVVKPLPKEHGKKVIVQTDDLAAEMQWMRPAQRALAEERPADALLELERYAARFPGGLLHEEYRALHAIALCAAGREREGRGEARAFLRELGGSMFATRVRAGCEISDEATKAGTGGHSPQ